MSLARALLLAGISAKPRCASVTVAAGNSRARNWNTSLALCPAPTTRNWNGTSRPCAWYRGMLLRKLLLWKTEPAIAVRTRGGSTGRPPGASEMWSPDAVRSPPSGERTSTSSRTTSPP